MNKKGINFFEKHIEKMVLGIAGVVCLWFLVTQVLLSPNYIEYDDEKFGPGEIDNYISEQAEVLEEKLKRKAETKEAYKPQLDSFDALFDSAMKDVDTNLYFPQPIISTRDIRDDRKYNLPEVSNVNDVLVEHIRAVAYIPTELVDAENTYDDVEHEPNDLDFVTVEAKFDVGQLYDSFYESFAGEYVKDEWRDPCLAIPVFAAVELQRQERLGDDIWSEWQEVPRAKIDFRSEMFEIIETVEELPAGGMKVRLLQYNDPQVRVDLLQPQAYQIASANEEWFSPLLHKEYLKVQKALEAQERREIRLAEKEEREREREKYRSERSRASETRTRGKGDAGVGGMGGMGGMMGGGGMMPQRKTPSKRSRSRRTRDSKRERSEKEKEAPKTKTVEDVYEELEEILITDESDFSRMDEPLTFWSHDDTVEPGKSYRYRIRLGVFNPIAGTNQLSEQSKPFKDQVVLWGAFSDVTDAVEIPKILYFFPHDIQESSKTVTVKVSRYALGYWYSKDFMVKGGEGIGTVVEYEPSEEEEDKGITVPDTIDYSTDITLLDVVPVSDWSGGKKLRSRRYFDMLYSFDGINIEHTPVKVSYWAGDIQAKFNEIRKSEKESKEPLREWGGKASRDRAIPGRQGMPGMMPGGMGGMFEMMQMER